MRYVKLSKYLSMILRHRPEAIGIRLDEHGWADVDELIAGIAKTREFNRDILEEIVRTDEKQRYSFNEDGTKIRANQGTLGYSGSGIGACGTAGNPVAWNRGKICGFH